MITLHSAQTGGRSWLPLALAASVAFFILSLAGYAQADEPEPAVFALIIGSNLSFDKDLAPLKYADDDAANYLDLFRLLGARTYLLSRFDDNTRRLHPEAASEAADPTRTALDQAITQASLDVQKARERAENTAFYIVYAGHGGVTDGEGYITLEDARLTGADLARLIARVPAGRVHVVIDACASYFLAYRRGPGGDRRPLRGFQDSDQLTADPRVGLLLSTSSARESHEWDGFQSGVFSHEVRSGLYGAADANGDGRVSYREIAAFVQRANDAIPNERFRPNLHARAPQGSDTSIDLRPGLENRIEIDGAHAAHYFIEDSRGVRILDVHNSARQSVRILRPSSNSPVYVRRATDEVEFVVPAIPEVMSLADIDATPPRVATRGAAHEAYNLLFSLPFDHDVVEAYVPTPPEGMPMPAKSMPAPERASALPLRRKLGWTATSVGIVAAGLGVALDVAAAHLSHSTSPTDSQRDASQRNSSINTLNTSAALGYVTGGLALATGVVLLLLPDSHFQIAGSPRAGFVGYGGVF